MEGERDREGGREELYSVGWVDKVVIVATWFNIIEGKWQRMTNFNIYYDTIFILTFH